MLTERMLPTAVPQFIVDDSSLRNARLTLIAATRTVIASGLAIIGVSAPDTM